MGGKGREMEGMERDGGRMKKRKAVGWVYHDERPGERKKRRESLEIDIYVK